ncbi:hypothetical protein UT300012_22360 [Paraclostridium bifermentans]
MRDGKRFGKLIWKDNTFIRPQRWSWKYLSVEEANERLHRYIPNMDILEYRGCNKSASVYCNDCKTEYQTKNVICSYMYGYRSECESCMEIARVQRDIEYLQEINLEYLGYIVVYIPRATRKIKYRCKVCGTVDYVCEPNLLGSSLSGCKKCKYDRTTAKYIELLKEYNCTYISRYIPTSINRNGLITYKYNDCGHEHTVLNGSLTANQIPECPTCKKLKKIKFVLERKEELCNDGFYLSEYRNSKDVDYIHLLCGEIRKQARIYKEGILCGYCQAKISTSKPKDHNKHLVQEKLIMLKNIQSFKNAWIKQVPDAIQQLPEGFAKIVLTHIDGWINNYEEIVAKYPNGDLGTVIENNPLYKQVEDTFYPIMEKFGFKR